MPAIELHAGPLSVVLDSGKLLYARLGVHEVLRRIYFAVRDDIWRTPPSEILGLELESNPDSFRVTLTAEIVTSEIDFRWDAILEGSPEGKIRYQVSGEARTGFRTNRIGLCVLHPIRECAGRPCSIGHVDGSTEQSEFPLLVAPHQPFRSIRTMTHEVVPGLRAEVQLEGDVFETEDQRNWGDGSYKTYCPPLQAPLPLQVKAGLRIEQSVTLSLIGDVPEIEARRREIVISRAGPVSTTLPRIGLGVASHGHPLSPIEVERLSRLHLSHLRVDLAPSRPGWNQALWQASEQARSIGAELEIALHLAGDADAELASLGAILTAVNPPVARWLVFHNAETSTSAKWIGLARRQLAAFNRSALFGAGTSQFFAELNRKRPPPSADLVCYSLNPQVHGSDNATLAEALEAQGWTVRTAQEFGNGLPVAVGPITLRPRFNPNAADAAPPKPGFLPLNVDVRQMSLFGAAWTAGTLKRQGEAGAWSATFYETTGWLGIMETRRGSPEPRLFPSIPGTVFPCYYVFGWLAAFSGGNVLPLASSAPLEADALAFRKDGRTRVILANFTGASRNVRLEGFPGEARVLCLNEETVRGAADDPLAWCTAPGENTGWAGEDPSITLRPFELVRLDFEEAQT